VGKAGSNKANAGLCAISSFTFWKLLIHLEIGNILATKLKSIWHQLIARLEWL